MRKLLFQGRNVYDLKNLPRIICAATMIQVDDNAFTVKTLKDTGLIYTCIYILYTCHVYNNLHGFVTISFSDEI